MTNLRPMSASANREAIRAAFHERMRRHQLHRLNPSASLQAHRDPRRRREFIRNELLRIINSDF